MTGLHRFPTGLAIVVRSEAPIDKKCLLPICLRLIAWIRSSAGNAAGSAGHHLVDMKEVRILNIFFPEYIVLVLIVLAAGCKALKAFRADGRNSGHPEKKVSGKNRT